MGAGRRQRKRGYCIYLQSFPFISLSMNELTPRQAEILKLINTQIARSGLPPTRAEICRAMGFRSPNAAEEHLRALARKGAIEMVAGTSRGIRPRQPPGGRSAERRVGQRVVH